jgi:hypothetical protein
MACMLFLFSDNHVLFHENYYICLLLWSSLHYDFLCRQTALILKIISYDVCHILIRISATSLSHDVYSSTMKMKTAVSSETLVYIQTTWCGIPDDSNLHTHICENIKPHIVGSDSCRKYTNFHLVRGSISLAVTVK